MAEKDNIVTEYITLSREYQSKYGKKTVVLLHVGSFMELYTLRSTHSSVDPQLHTNIEEPVQLCGLNLAEKKQTYTHSTSSEKYTILMAGFRDYSIEKYLKILVTHGYTAVVYVQVKDESGKGFNRILGSIQSPSTYIGYEIDAPLTSTRETNNLMAVWLEKYTNPRDKSEVFVCGIANINCMTGYSHIFEYQMPFLVNTTLCDELERMVAIYNPSETIVISALSKTDTDAIIRYAGIKSNNLYVKSATFDVEIQRLNQEKYVKHILSTFYGEDAYDICDEFRANPISTQAFCYLLHFVQEHNRDLTKKIAIPTFTNTSTRLLLANHTLKQLNIINDHSIDGSLSGNLSSVVSFTNRCQTCMGKREFMRQITNPTFDEAWLNREYEMIGVFMHPNTSSVIPSIRKMLFSIYDIEKIQRQMVTKKIHPLSIYHLYQSVQECFKIARIVEEIADNTDIIAAYFMTTNMTTSIQRILKFLDTNLYVELCQGATNFDQNIIKPGVSSILDKLIKDSAESNRTFTEIHSQLNLIMNQHDHTNTSTTEYIKIHETEKSGSTLQITKKRGQLLKTILAKIPEITIHTIKIKTCDIKMVPASAGNEEFSFPLLNKAQTDILKYKDEIAKQISIAFYNILDIIVCQEWFSMIERVAVYVTKIDVLQSKVYMASEYKLCRPHIDSSADKSYIDVQELRHILIEQLNQKELYVTNDICLSAPNLVQNPIGTIIYGTNAVGKTSFIRSLGIAIIMAQSGMYVPCAKMTYKPYQSIFTRILGNDNMFKGLSTFAVEMSELRLILKMADQNSIVLGDELCSGTEIESALSIFMAGLMALHQKEVSFVFATHFHEILKFDEMRELSKMSVQHLSVIYDRERDCLIYDRKLKPGSGSRMYGLEVCKSLYMPQEFLDCAYKLRAKYNIETRGELNNPSAAKYNSAKIRGICEICKINMGQEIHHMQEQRDADQAGYISGFHKNHPANLVSVCESCHDKIHNTNTKSQETSSNTSSSMESVAKSKNKMMKKKTTIGYVHG